MFLAKLRVRFFCLYFAGNLLGMWKHYGKFHQMTIAHCFYRLFSMCVRDSPLSLLFTVKLFSSLETKKVLKIPNETFSRITYILRNKNPTCAQLTLPISWWIVITGDDDRVSTNSLAASNVSRCRPNNLISVGPSTSAYMKYGTASG